MIYEHVKCPNFVVKNPNGSVRSLQCKLCGIVIADTVDRIRGYERTRSGQLVKVVERQLTRFTNYREIKIAFDDPLYYHVTHGCADCFHIHLEPDVLAELHAADQAESPDGFTAREMSKTPIGVSVLQVDQTGIV